MKKISSFLRVELFCRKEVKARRLPDELGRILPAAALRPDFVRLLGLPDLRLRDERFDGGDASGEPAESSCRKIGRSKPLKKYFENLIK
jgi:hypothetical protein